MFRILLNEQTIGESEFETGDPPMGCVSGALKTKSSVDNLLKLILNNGGISKDGEYRLELDSRFSVVDVQGKKLTAGRLVVVRTVPPAPQEMFTF